MLLFFKHFFQAKLFLLLVSKNFFSTKSLTSLFTRVEFAEFLGLFFILFFVLHLFLLTGLSIDKSSLFLSIVESEHLSFLDTFS